MERLGVQADLIDAKLIVERFDTDRDNKLGFWEFSNMFLPIESIIRDEVERRKAIWDIGFETKELIRRLLRKMLDAESLIENIRQRIGREPNLSVRKAFECLDELNRGYITSLEIKKSFELVN